MTGVPESGAFFTHDHFIRWNMGHLETARHFFKLCLPSELCQKLDWESLTQAKNDHLNHKLGEVITDMLFTLAIEGTQCHLSLLIEHKSEGAMKKQVHPLPFLLRRNEVRIMEDAKKSNPAQSYPIIHLIGLYHGSRPYKGPLSVAESMDAPDDLIPDRWQEPMHMVDLNALDDRVLMDAGRLGLVLIVMKHIYDQNFEDIVQKLCPLISQVDRTPDGADFSEVLFNYLLNKAPMEKDQIIKEIAVKSLKEESVMRVKTAVERLRESIWSEFAQRFEEQEKQLHQQGAQLHQQGAQLHQKDEQLHQQGAQLHQKDEEILKYKKLTASSLLDQGWSVDRIVEITDLDPNTITLLARQQAK